MVMRTTRKPPSEAKTQALKLIQIGDSVGVIFPNELLTQLHLGVGDEFYLTETPDGL
jgi:hypothetical protein